MVPALIIGVSVVLVSSQKDNYVRGFSTNSAVDEQSSKVDNPLNVQLVVNHDGGDDRVSFSARNGTVPSPEPGLKRPLDESRGTNAKSNYTLENEENDRSHASSMLSSTEMVPETLEVPNRLDFMQLKRDPTASLKKLEEEIKDLEEAQE